MQSITQRIVLSLPVRVTDIPPHTGDESRHQKKLAIGYFHVSMIPPGIIPALPALRAGLPRERPLIIIGFGFGFSKFVWADVERPQIYHLYFYICAVGPQNTKCPQMGLRIGLRG